MDTNDSWNSLIGTLILSKGTLKEYSYYQKELITMLPFTSLPLVGVLSRVHPTFPTMGPFHSILLEKAYRLQY